METTIMTKPNMQRILDTLRADGVKVTKTSTDGYIAEYKGKQILRASKAANGYLVKSVPGLISAR